MSTIPTPSQSDEHGSTKSDRRHIRAIAVEAAARAVSGTSFAVTGSSEINAMAINVAERFERYIITGE